MTDQRIIQGGTPVQAYRHPTPAEIQAAIIEKLGADYDRNPIGGKEPFIPVRVFRLVREAITEACDAGGAA